MMAMVGVKYASYDISIMPLAPKDGNRVEVCTLDDPSEEIARDIVAYYRDKAGKEGQIVVRKPSIKLGGAVVPFVVDNCDGQGAVVNRDFFPA